MKLSWRYIRSFFSEEVIEVASSPYNSRLTVEYANGRFVVNAETVNFSFGGLDTVFREAFRKLHISQRPIHDVLVLGLGAGNVPTILAEHARPYEVVGVEIDPEIVRLGETYFRLGDYGPQLKLHTVLDDAIAFVRKTKLRFDLVVVDLFVDELVPAAAESPEFLEDTARLLQPKGLLLFNRLMHTPALEKQSVAFTRIMKGILPSTTYIKAHTNRILVYEKQ